MQWLLVKVELELSLDYVGKTMCLSYNHAL